MQSEVYLLINAFPMSYKDDIKKHSNEGFLDTHLKETIEEMKISYPFKGVPQELVKNHNGYAVTGGFRRVDNGDPIDGWTGAAHFFDSHEAGSCCFTENNLKAAHGGAELFQELITYDVKNNPTMLYVSGNKLTGYTWHITWYNGYFMRELECANKKFNPDFKEKVIILANKIEENQW